MSVKQSTIWAIVGISFLIILLVLKLPDISQPDSNQPLPQLQAKDDLQPKADGTATGEIRLQEVKADLQAMSQTVNNTVKVTNNKIGYSADWCIAAIDLNQTDNSYYQQQLQDWRLSNGGLNGAITDKWGHTYLSDASFPLIPYLEYDYDDLWSQINKDNEFAMLVALDRSDIDMASRRDIAQRLVVKGHTGKALTYLVMFELVNAKLVYNTTGEVNADVKSKLYRALTYTAYGIEHFDLSAAFIYLNMLNAEEFPAELKPVHALGNSNNMRVYLKEFTQYIDNVRANLNLPNMADTDVPKAAKHDFDTTLARFYMDYGNELTDLKRVLAGSTRDMLNSSDCVTRQVALFSALERQRLSNK